MPSRTYRSIWQAMRQKTPLTFIYRDCPRAACPVILGYDADGRETLFAYQFDGATSGGSTLPQWRCLKLDDLHDLQARPGPWHEGTGHRRTQTCVRHVDVDVNVPETLTHKTPLPLGSPDLRRPRASDPG
jgi:hypothetical protein